MTKRTVSRAGMPELVQVDVELRAAAARRLAAQVRRHGGLQGVPELHALHGARQAQQRVRRPARRIETHPLRQVRRHLGTPRQALLPRRLARHRGVVRHVRHRVLVAGLVKLAQRVARRIARQRLRQQRRHRPQVGQRPVHVGVDALPQAARRLRRHAQHQVEGARHRRPRWRQVHPRQAHRRRAVVRLRVLPRHVGEHPALVRRHHQTRQRRHAAEKAVARLRPEQHQDQGAVNQVHEHAGEGLRRRRVHPPVHQPDGAHQDDGVGHQAERRGANHRLRPQAPIQEPRLDVAVRLVRLRPRQTRQQDQQGNQHRHQ